MAQSLDLRVSILDAKAKVELKEIDGKIQQIQKRAEKGINLVSSVETRDVEGKLKGVVNTYKDAADKIEVYSQKINKAGKVSFSVSEKSGVNWAEKQAQAYGKAIAKQEELERSFTKITASVSSFSSLSDTAFAQYSKGVMSATEATEQSARAAQYSSQTWQQYYNILNGVGQSCGVTAKEVSIFGELSDTAFQQYSSGAISAREANQTLGASSNEVAESQRQVAEETSNAAEQAQRSSKSFTLLHAVLIRLVHTAISAVTRSFREALTEMKNVDSELVVVRKVSDATAEELSALKDRAYEVGAAYGVAASDYLNAAAEMTRAGYREQAGDLAELATKLQLVGDVSQDVANQFLIATDKSYKMNGNYQKLSETIDKLNEIDNNFATSFEKVADGIGLLAPVAAQANVSFDEMAAAIGTVTAVTQRSGTESARALRSLFLNIIRDTTTEIDDGVTWSVEEINNLSDALKKYAPEVVKAAEATGELINPMEAVGALAQSYKEGLLTNQDLFEIVSGLGGKLRTSQLLALIQNWDMYNQMLEKTANAAGSADKEVSNALDSWNVKLNQLKNTSTQFTQSLLDSEDIKSFIDSLNFLIKSIDDPDQFEGKFANAFENAAHKLVERLPRIQKVISQVSLTIAKTLIETIKNEAITVLRELADGSSKATSELAKELPAIVENIFQIVGEIAMQSLADGELAYNLTVALLEGIIKAIPRAFEGFWHGIANTILSLAAESGNSDELKKATDSTETFLNFDREFVKAEEEAKDAIEDTSSALTEQSDTIKEATDALAAYKKALEGGEKGDSLKSYAEAYKSAVEMFEKGLTGTNAYMSAVDLLFGSGIVDTYEEAGELLGNKFIKAMFESGGDDFGANAANYIRSHIDDFSGVSIKEADDGTFSLIVDDMEAFAESANLSVGAVEALVDALDGFESKELDGTVKTVGSFIDKDKTIDIPIESNADDFFESTEKSIERLDHSVIHIDVVGGNSVLDKNGGVRTQGGSTTHQYSDNATHGGHSGSYGHGGNSGSFASGTKSARGGLSLVNEEGAELIYANGRAWIAGDGEPTITNLPSGAGVFNARQTKDILNRSGIQSNANSNVNVADITGGGNGLTAGGIPITNGGSKNGKKPSQSLASILEQLAEYINKILKKAKEALQAQLDAIDEQINKLRREHDAEEDANRLEELRLKILEAEKRLAEAQQERTVRYFNRETGQWEWMADQKAVAEAQKALEDAQKEYDDEVAEQEYQAQLQALQDQKDTLNAAYDDLSNRWNKILEALQEAENGSGTTDVAKLLASLGKIAGNATSSDVKKILDELALFTSNPSSVLDAETTARIMSAQGSTAHGGTPVLSAMLGSSAYDLNAKGNSMYGTNASTIVGDTIYYINGVQIGSDMMDKPLSQILSVLPIYAN